MTSLFSRRPMGQVFLLTSLLAAPTAALEVIEYTDEASFRDALDTPVTIDFDSLTAGTFLQGDEYSDQGRTREPAQCRVAGQEACLPGTTLEEVA